MTCGWISIQIAFKSEFNSPAKVLVLSEMKNNITSAANCLIVDTICLDT